jgi:hypothetical protein
MSADRNLRHTVQKVRPAIHQVYLSRKEENMKQHVKECRNRGYAEINYTHKGVNYSATTGPVAIDGAGCKRAYNHHITGTETAAIVQSPVAGVCLHVEHSQVSLCCMLFIYTLDISNNSCISTTQYQMNCINCTCTLNRQIEARGGIVLPDTRGLLFL